MNTIGDELMKKLPEKKKGRWRKSIEQNGITKEISVREADNDGYIINLSVYGDFPKEDGETEYKHKEKEIISKTNPLGDGEDMVKKGMDSLENALEEGIEF